ncbi:CHASE domain-containing protein [uncultured Hoeflea sp.]|uniref:CHASE domain-containing protein n=1 Tax=uncultured Hoeflea sp. TaxID=538666 RepID=UPI0030EC9516|tara:strand:- start:71210 stop:75577 length:4368 start_codon:yes stop_codon:yes gene_type:complete
MMKNDIGLVLARILVVAALYFISGRLGLFLAVPPGYATVIWPPSGIALGALFIYGWRLWPGILIGSFLLNSYISGAYTVDTGADGAKMLAALAIASGSTLQGLVGYGLVNRFVGLPLSFDRIRQIVRLLVIAGPVACVIAASIGVSTLYFSGILPATELSWNWFTWWTGDMLGVVTFLPLLLLTPINKNNLTWRGTTIARLPVTALMIMLIPLGLTFYAWKISSEANTSNGEIQFESLAVENKKALLSRINSYENALLGGVAYFQGSENISRNEWRRYVDMLDIQENFPGINGLGWITSLAPSGIDRFLNAARADGAPNFEIRPKNVEAGHYIINFIEPESINRQAIGLNIAFEENRKQAADLSRSTGKPAITKRIILVQDAEKTPGFLLLHPMYKEGFEPGSSADEWATFDGWIYAPFIAKNFMNELTQSQGNTINFRVYDGDSEDPEALIYDSRKVRVADYVPAFTKREQIDVMQQRWLIVWESTPGFEQSSRNNNPVLVLAGGLLISFLLGLFLFVANIRRNDAIEDTPGLKALVLPAMVFLVLAVGTLGLYRALTATEQDYLKSLTSNEANRISAIVAAETKGKISALERMASRLEFSQNRLEAAWRTDATNFIEDFEGLRVISKVGTDNIMQQTQQSPANERLVWVNAVLDPARADVVAAAIAADVPKLSSPLELAFGRHALTAYFPLNVLGVSDGFLAGVFSVEEFFNIDIPRELLDRYRFEIAYEGEIYARAGNQSLPLATDWLLESKIQVLDRAWSLTSIPTAEFLNSQRSQLPSVALLAGFLISVLAAIAAYTTGLSRLKTARLEASNVRIKEEATRNSTVMNTVLDGVVTINSQGLIETINPAGLRLFGYAKEEIIGHNIKILMPPPYHDAHDGFLKNYLNTGEQKVIGLGRQVVGRRKDGSVFPMDLAVNEMKLDGRRMFVGTIRDTSEAVAAAQALHESDTLKTAILASTEYLIVATEMDGTVMVFNEAAEKALGYTAEEVVGKQTPALWHDPSEIVERAKVLTEELGETVEPGFEVFRRKVDLDGTEENEWSFIRRDGTRFPALLAVTPLRDEDQQMTGYLGVILDITKRKEMDRLKSDFVSIVSHELRTPLTSIRGALGLMAGPMAKELPEKAGRLIDIAHKNSERLTLLINDILDIDKIESGQMRFDMKEEDVGSLVTQAVEVNQPYAEKLGVVFKATDISPDLKANVDAARLAQVLSNLLSNAAKFSDRGSEVEISALKAGKRVRISVRDHGAGIAEEFRSKIFGKFSQGDSSSTRVKGGSGLGLHISKQIVERMGGKIGFETETGLGTTFWMELPLRVQDHVTGNLEKDDVQRAMLHYQKKETPTLLHIEDDQDLSRVLAMSLQGKIEVVPAASLQEAEQLLRNQRFDLVVLDVELPDGSGLQFLTNLISQITPPVPVMILSASEVSGDIEKSVSAALVKSRASEERILETIETLVDG